MMQSIVSCRAMIEGVLGPISLSRGMKPLGPQIHLMLLVLFRFGISEGVFFDSSDL